MRVFQAMAVFAFVLAPVAASAAVLITAQEAGQPEVRTGPAGSAPGGYGTDRGTPGRPPDVVVQMPRGAVASPFPLRVAFTPHNGAHIVPDSITVTLLTTPETDLSERVRRYVSTRGIDMPSAEAPAGQFQLRIEVADDAGHIGTSNVELTVSR